MRSPWLIHYSNGAGDRHELEQGPGSVPVQLRYRPVRPELSSSGVYDGGREISNAALTASESRELLAVLDVLRASAAAPHAARAMGTGLLEWRSPEHSGRVLLRGGEKQALDDLLHAIRKRLDAM